jgi:hypothetical protein
MGGLWWYIVARSADEITGKYHDVIVLEQPPSWWSAEDEARTTTITLGESRPGLDELRK